MRRKEEEEREGKFIPDRFLIPTLKSHICYPALAWSFGGFGILLWDDVDV